MLEEEQMACSMTWCWHAGLTSEDEDKPWVLEAQQGDRISGKISRKEVASVAVSALSTEASIGKPQSCLSPLFSYVGQLPVTHQQVSEHQACSFSSGTGCTWAHPLLMASRAPSNPPHCCVQERQWRSGAARQAETRARGPQQRIWSACS